VNSAWRMCVTHIRHGPALTEFRSCLLRGTNPVYPLASGLMEGSELTEEGAEPVDEDDNNVAGRAQNS
jgi:hypothetical protein